MKQGSRPQDSLSLGPRRAPAQARARKTVENLLETAAELLAEVGIAAFNTNRLAERAGVRVRTVYRYFPNKLAVVTALAERMVGEWNAWFDELEGLADPQSDWRQIWVSLLRTFVDGIRGAPGGVAIRHAMHAVPELRAIDLEDNARLASRVAKVLHRRQPTLKRAEANAVGRTLLESAAAVIDLALTSKPAEARRLLRNLEAMHLAYLETVLEE